MTIHLEHDLVALKETLLTMASYAESAVTKSIKALVERDDDGGSREQDTRAVHRNPCALYQCGLKICCLRFYRFPEKFTTSFSAGISFLCASAGPLASAGFQPSPRPTTSNDARE